MLIDPFSFDSVMLSVQIKVEEEVWNARSSGVEAEKEKFSDGHYERDPQGRPLHSSIILYTINYRYMTKLDYWYIKNL
jgi:hypothetical protein